MFSKKKYRSSFAAKITKNILRRVLFLIVLKYFIINITKKKNDEQI